MAPKKKTASKITQRSTSKSTQRGTSKTAKRAAPAETGSGFTDDEKLAMKERARELKAASRRGEDDRKEGEREVLAKIAQMAEPDRSMARRIHDLVTSSAPELTPRTWYGMPAYAKDGNVICFFQNAGKFKARYSTLGFNDKAKLDEGTMWPTGFAITRLTPADEARIVALVRRAVGE
jgi:uncharacterized protein YdhG (YjbR/CyaY superfamily)